MDLEQISGAKALEFAKKYDYIRAAGTPNEKKAANEICEYAKSLGLTATIEPFEFDTWQILDSDLKVIDPYEKEYPVKVYARSGLTPPEGMDADFIYVEDGDRINLSLAKGKIAMINGRVHEDELRRLEKAQVAAFIGICGTPLDVGIERVPVNEELKHVPSTTIPGLCMHYLDAAELIECGTKKMHICVRQQQIRRASQNIVIRIPGTEWPDEIIAFTAHYDSVPDGPGAYDNMAGVAIVMEACRYFTSHPPKHTLEFVLLGAEERGLKGSKAFLAARKANLSDYKLNLNVDLAGQTIGGTVLGVTAHSTVCDALNMILWKHSMGAVTRNAVWSSDSNTFAYNGIPAVTLDRDGYGMHTCHDTVALLSAWALEKDCKMITAIAYELDQYHEMPFSRTIPEDIKKGLDVFFSNPL